MMSKEVLERLKLFIRSPNSVHNLGQERDKFVPNPQAVDNTAMQNYYKLGFVMAATYKSGEILNINLPSMLWKFLLSTKIQFSKFDCFRP